MRSGKNFLAASVAAFLVVSCAFGQKTAPVKTTATLVTTPRVSKIDALGLKGLIKPNGKPLLVNFWATWCDPCREEFPELVKINNDFKGKIDFITISLDDLADINSGVPQFLTEMKADMPAFLLVTQDEESAISSVSKDWSGGLPFTMLINEKGETAYFRQGKVRPDILRGELSKITSLPSPD
ncbi:MAG: thioredoxin domain-containing protein [Acidobacteriota bacterium]